MASPYDPQHAAIRSRIEHYAAKYGIPASIGIWQIWQESRFNPNAQSSAGAKGIAQFMPATAAEWGVNVWDVESSLNGWGKYMRWILQQPYVAGNISYALAAYNGGVGNVKKYGGIPPFTETKNYVATIMANAGAGATAGVDLIAGDDSTLLIAAGVLLFLLLW